MKNTIILFDKPTGELDAPYKERINQAVHFGADFVTVPGKLFEVGHYPGKGFSLSDSEAEAEVLRFNASGGAPMNYEHKAGLLDGMLGKVSRIWKEGKTIRADFQIPSWLAAVVKETGKPPKVSAEWNKTTKQLRAAAWTLNPHITDAQLAAFARDAVDAEIETGATNALELPKGSNMTRQDKINALLQTAKDAGRTATAEEITALFSDEESEYERVLTENKTLKESDLKARAGAFADATIKAQKAFPSQRPALCALFSALSVDDDDNEVTVSFSAGGTERTGGRVEALKSLFELAPKHGLTEELLSSDADGKKLAEQYAAQQKALFSKSKTDGADGADPGDVPLTEARFAELMAHTSLGASIIAAGTPAGTSGTSEN